MAKKVKVVQCPNCGTLNDKKLSVCTNCGTGLKEPIYKKKWFIALVIVLVFGIGATALGGGNNKPANNNSSTPKAEEKIEYKKYKVTQLFDDLNKNAMKAEKNHQDEYVEISGYLDVIDSDGSYFSVGAGENNYDYMFQNIHCRFHGDNEENQKDVVMEMDKNDKITVRGKITSIGEILGYDIDIDEVIAK